MYESGGYEMPREKEEHNPFADGNGVGGGPPAGMTSQEYEQRQHDEEIRRRAAESTETVTLEPRRENERRV